MTLPKGGALLVEIIRHYDISISPRRGVLLVTGTKR